MVNVLIVEDEPNYSDTLEMFIDELGYRVTGVAVDAAAASRSFKTERPDLVLMDINLKGDVSGIDLARNFQSTNPTPIIFITSFEDKETFSQAKKTCPSDYLVKPFDPDRLERSMELAIQTAYSREENVFANNSHAVLAPNCFFVKERNKLVKVDVKDILWVEVEDKYCMLHTNKKVFALRESLKELAGKLDPQLFVQTHRSYIVNIAEVEDIDMNTFVVHINGEEVPLGRSYKDDLLDRLKML